jgi:ribose transport system substrate-binding protein
MACVTLLTAACNRAQQAGGGGEEPPTVGLSLSTLQNPFFVTLRDGAQAAADEAGISLDVADAQDDAQTQANDIEDFVTQQVDAIIVNAVDSAAVVAPIESANEADIPVITVDREAEGGDIAAHIASNNQQGGEMAGKALLKSIGGSGDVAQLEGIAGTTPARDRGAGFEAAIEGSNAELVASQTANFDREEGFTVAQNIFQANPDLAGLFAQNDEMALGAVEAAREAGNLGSLAIVGFDAIPDALEAIRKGDMVATIAQQPDLLGRLSVEAADGIVAGEQVKAERLVEVKLVTKANVGQFE